MNQRPALRQSANTSKPGQRMDVKGKERQVKKNKSEKARRDCERHYLDRISRLFKAPQQQPQWAKKDVLSLGETIFLIDGRN